MANEVPAADLRAENTAVKRIRIKLRSRYRTGYYTDQPLTVEN